MAGARNANWFSPKAVRGWAGSSAKGRDGVGVVSQGKVGPLGHGLRSERRAGTPQQGTLRSNEQ